MTDWNLVFLGGGIVSACFAVAGLVVFLRIRWMIKQGTVRLKFDPDVGVRDVLQRWQEEIDR